MAPENLRQATKYDHVLEKMLVIMTDSERDQLVPIYGKLRSEEMFQASFPFNQQHQNDAVMALELIKYYLHEGQKPSYLNSIPEFWKENV